MDLKNICKFWSLIKTHHLLVCNIINMMPYNGCSQMLHISLKTEKSFIAHPWHLLCVVGLEEYSAHDWRAATSGTARSSYLARVGPVPRTIYGTLWLWCGQFEVGLLQLLQLLSGVGISWEVLVLVSPNNSPHKWPLTRKLFLFDDVVMYHIRMHFAQIFAFKQNYWEGCSSCGYECLTEILTFADTGFIHTKHCNTPIDLWPRVLLRCYCVDKLLFAEVNQK